jgi:hypothetical protein
VKLKRLIYASRPFGFDDLALVGILASARANNARDGITGALICREDLYLQLLEGPDEAVDAAFARIARDDRHTGVSLLLDEDADDLLFPDWAMKHDPAQSWMWTPQQVREDAIASASEDEVRNVFRRIV